MVERRNTELESAGAEFLVLGNLLMNKIAAYKTYADANGYDIVAVNPETNKSCRIQVKSRDRSGVSGFPVNNFDCDFIAFVVLNRGRSVKGQWSLDHLNHPDIYVLPIDYIRSKKKDGDKTGKAYFKMTDLESYPEDWALIKLFLGVA